MMAARDLIPPRALRYASILRDVSQETGVPICDIVSDSRFGHHIAARRSAIAGPCPSSLGSGAGSPKRLSERTKE